MRWSRANYSIFNLRRVGTRGLWVIHEARLHMMIFSQRKKPVNFYEIKKNIRRIIFIITLDLLKFI